MVRNAIDTPQSVDGKPPGERKIEKPPSKGNGRVALRGGHRLRAQANRSKPPGRGIPLPREHGAWGMFLTGLFLGSTVAGRINVPGLLFFVASLALFSLRQPLFLLSLPQSGTYSSEARRNLLTWAAAFLLSGLLLGLPLLFVYGRWLLIPVAGAGVASLASDLFLRRRRLDRTGPGELLGIAQLSLVVPAIHYSILGRDVTTAGLLWALTFLFYAGSVPYVKLKLRHLVNPPRSLGEKFRAGLLSLLFQSGLLVAATALAIRGVLPALAPLALLPNAIKTFAGIFSVPDKVNFKKVGWTEVATATAFALLTVLAYHLSG